jgi:hypothetical protein
LNNKTASEIKISCISVKNDNKQKTQINQSNKFSVFINKTNTEFEKLIEEIKHNLKNNIL